MATAKGKVIYDNEKMRVGFLVVQVTWEKAHAMLMP